MLIPVFCVLLSPACKPFEKKEPVQQLDTLKAMVLETENTLILDMKTIGSRADSLRQRLTVLNTQLKAPLTEEQQAARVKLQGILTNYDAMVM